MNKTALEIWTEYSELPANQVMHLCNYMDYELVCPLVIELRWMWALVGVTIERANS